MRMRRDELNDLAAFLAVADERSFTRAAAKLDMSPSALSHAMKGLEKRLGLRLLARTTRSVAPTEAGERLLGTLRPAFEEIGAGLASIGELRDKPAGTVRVAACKHSATTILWPVLPGFLREYPEVRAEVTVVDAATDIVAERYDAGIEIGERVARDMTSIRVGPDLRQAVVAAPEYFTKHPTPARPQDLAALPCIGYRMAPDGGLCPWEFVEDGRTFRVKVAGRLVLNDVELLMAAALAGQGIAHFYEDMVADHLAAGRLVRVLDEWCPPFPGYYLYHPSRRQTPPALAALIDALRDREGDRPAGSRAAGCRRPTRPGLRSMRPSPLDATSPVGVGPMIRPSRASLVVLALVVIGLAGAGTLVVAPALRDPVRWGWSPGARSPAPPSVEPADAGGDGVETVTRSDDADVPLATDQLASKTPTFDPEWVDRRSVDGWQVNASGAVIKLDTPRLFGQGEVDRPLAASYAAVMKDSPWGMLPSVNLIDGKAKQFDDGLYAAIDRAYYSGDPALGAKVEGHRALIGRLLAAVKPGSAAADYLAAGLSLDESHPPTVPVGPSARRLGGAFRSDPVRSRPIGYYTWDATLGDCFRVLRFFSQPIDNPAIIAELTRALRADSDLLARVCAANALSARLTNPLGHPSVADLAADPTLKLPEDVPVSLFPPSTSREVELFNRIFRNGLPPNAQMMRALVETIRSGTVDLTPGPDSGWYGYQAFALEPLLLPERGEGADHLLLTRDYKKRSLVAFEALLTKRRETHARQLKYAIASAAPGRVVRPGPPIRPRLRVEPNPSYYLRTARAYGFVAALLDATFGAEAMATLHGRAATGTRPEALGAEVRGMADLFLGLACLSSEDIGHRLATTPAEAARRAAAEAAATAWLDRIKADPDLAADTRVAIPIGHDPNTRKVRLWATIGVSLTQLKAEYARSPQVRQAEGGDWRVVRPDELEPSYDYIAVEEFAELELDGGRVFTRDELRAICDASKTRDAIRRALGAIR